MSCALNYLSRGNSDNLALRPFGLESPIQALGLTQETNRFLTHSSFDTVSVLLNVEIPDLLSRLKGYFQSKTDISICLKDIEDRFYFYQLCFNNMKYF